MFNYARWYSLAVFGLFVIHVGLTFYGAALHSPTLDEPAHLASGVLNLQNGNYEPYRVNPLRLQTRSRFLFRSDWAGQPFGVASGPGLRLLQP
jgi:hypothetical protein